MGKSIILSVLSLFLVFTSCQSSAGDGGGKLNPNMFRSKIMEYKDEVVLDVRTPQEYQGGHIEDAVNIDWNGSNFEQQVSKLDKNKPVFVYCHAGGRSAAAAGKLEQMGFTKVYDLEGGMMNWRNLGMPVNNNTTYIPKGMSVKDYHNELNDSKLVLVDFYATWCSPCKKMSPFLKEIAENQSDKLKLMKIDADENETVVSELNISALPTLLLYKNNKLVWSHVGYIGKDDLLEKISIFN